MRSLTRIESGIVRWFAEQLVDTKRILLNDLDKAIAEDISGDQFTIRFHIEGYVRPPYCGERPLPVDACVLDADGAKLVVTVSVDANGRLFELQAIRFDPGPVVHPDWPTLRRLEPGEIIDLGAS